MHVFSSSVLRASPDTPTPRPHCLSVAAVASVRCSYGRLPAGFTQDAQHWP